MCLKTEFQGICYGMSQKYITTLDRYFKGTSHSTQLACLKWDFPMLLLALKTNLE